MSTFQILLDICGGLGLFLLGMGVMSDGLRALAAERMRRWLTRFTRSQYSGAVTGALTTAVLQSSSATTVAAVGFVSAGLLTFSQALGIIFGANLGTTLTGWLVAVLGLKLNLGNLMLPLVLLGALLKLFGRGRLQQSGTALAGFGLIFIGITMLQSGMSGLESDVIPIQLPADSWLTRLQFIALGVIFTLITQSSSAGVAATLTALYAGTIEFHHAASLVIGMDIGTTFTAALATLGGSSATRRTGLSHVIYNLLTGLMAFLLISPYIGFINHWQGDLQDNAELYLVGFHTGFNLIGVLLVLPFTRQFSHLMQRLIPEQEDTLTIGLERHLLKEPGIALTATHAVFIRQFHFLLETLVTAVQRRQAPSPRSIYMFQQSLQTTQDYVDSLHLSGDNTPQWQRLYAITHALDHIQRFYHRLRELDSIATAYESPRFTLLLDQLVENIRELEGYLENGDWETAESFTERMAQAIEQMTDEFRNEYIASVASDTLSVTVAHEYMHALRWLNRVSTHIARISHYLASSSFHPAADKGQEK